MHAIAADRGRGGRARPDRRHRRRAADAPTRTALRCATGSRRARSTRRSSTARCSGCSRRRRSSACSTRRSTQPPDVGRPRLAGASRARAPAGRGVGRPAVQRRDAPARPRRAGIAVIGPNADSAEALMGCYSFANHVLAHHPEVAARASRSRAVARGAAAREFPDAHDRRRAGLRRRGRRSRPASPTAVEAAAAADVAIVVVGDRAGLFGRGTVGEGNDVESLELPGVQRELVEAVVRHGHPGRDGRCSPVGRTRSTGHWMAETAPRRGAAGVLPRRGGRLRRSPRSSPGASRPSGDCRSRCPAPPVRSRTRTCTRSWAARTRSRAPTAPRCCPFGFGLSYTTFAHADLRRPEPRRARTTRSPCPVRVRNTGSRAGADVVQLYARDVYASVTRPVAQLLGYARVALDAGRGGRRRVRRADGASGVHRSRAACASSSPVRSSCGSEPRAPIARRPARSNSPVPPMS